MAMAGTNDNTSRIARYAALTLVISVAVLYLGDRFGMLMDLYDRPFLDCYMEVMAALPAYVAASPLSFSFEAVPLLYGCGLFLAVWLVWLRFSVFIGNYRAGEEAGSARWGTRKEGEAFRNADEPDSNILLTEHYAIATRRKDFDLEHDRNLNVMVIGGSGSGKTRYYVKPNLMQMNASFFVTDPKASLIEEVGGMFADPESGYRLKCFNMFKSMGKLYDGFGPGSTVQMTVVNTLILREELDSRRFFDPQRQITAQAAEDAETFNAILAEKTRQGVSNIRRRRFMTITCAAETADASVPKLSRLEASSSRLLGGVGSKCRTLDGKDRLTVLHGLLNPGKPFDMDYKRDLGLRMPQTTKDLIAPTTIDFKPEGRCDCFRLDDMWGQVLVFRRFGSELTDRALADIVDLPIPMAVSWFAQPIEQAKAKAFVQQRSAWIDKEVIEEQRTAVSKGYDFSILPYELRYSKEETEGVLNELTGKGQHLYQFTGLVYTYAPSRHQLDNQVLRIISSARGNSIELDVLDYRQPEALNSMLPLGYNHIDVSRYSTTAEITMLMPFATQELADEGGNYCGQNKHSRNLVFCDRKKLASPMGFISGKTGSGKSMFVKTEMTGTILTNPTDEIFVIDRAGEYTGIARRYGGSVFDFSVTSGASLNPFDTVSVSHMSAEAQVAFKTDAMLAQAGASAAEAGKKLSEIDQSIITRCVEMAFDRREDGGDPPLLGDFYEILREQPEPEARAIALRYERFVKGSMSFFNRPTNVSFDNRIIDFNLRELPDSMLVFALINVCEAVRNRMYSNYERGVRTWLYVEEIQSLFAYPTVLNYFSRFANEGRKFGLLLTGITQNAVAMLNNEAAQNIVLNADFLMLLKQSPVDRLEWSSLLNLSEQEEECIDESVEPGDGLLIAGAARIPIRGKFPDKMPDGSKNPLYALFSTNPNDE